MYLAHVRQMETEDEWFWPADAEWWRGYGMNLPDDVLEKVYSRNAERLLAAPLFRLGPRLDQQQPSRSSTRSAAPGPRTRPSSRPAT